MADFEHVLQALAAYRGDNDTLNAFVQAAETDLGPDWVQSIFTISAGWDAALVEKLNHAYNYYAATASWTEIQGYLADPNLNVATVAERLPTLEHWLTFFGDAAEEPLRQLRERLGVPTTPTAIPEMPTEGALEPVGGTLEQPQAAVSEKVETSEEFLVRQVFQDIDLLDRIQAWTAARCVELGNIEIYAYKFYGFQVDVMEHAKRGITEVLEDPTLYPLVEDVKEQGMEYLRRKLTSLESDLQVAYDNAQTDITPLVAEDADATHARSLLGSLDTSDSKEFLGPAPDGFEMVDDPYGNIDEEKVTEAYHELEKTVSSKLEEKEKPVKPQQSSGGTSGRKMSFSLNNKTAKPKPEVKE